MQADEGQSQEVLPALFAHPAAAKKTASMADYSRPRQTKADQGRPWQTKSF